MDEIFVESISTDDEDDDDDFDHDRAPSFSPISESSGSTPSEQTTQDSDQDISSQIEVVCISLF